MCLGALRAEHSLKVARSARAVQRFPLVPRPRLADYVVERAPDGVHVAFACDGEDPLGLRDARARAVTERSCRGSFLDVDVVAPRRSGALGLDTTGPLLPFHVGVATNGMVVLVVAKAMTAMEEAAGDTAASMLADCGPPAGRTSGARRPGCVPMRWMRRMRYSRRACPPMQPPTLNHQFWRKWRCQQ